MANNALATNTTATTATPTTDSNTSTAVSASNGTNLYRAMTGANWVADEQRPILQASLAASSPIHCPRLSHHKDNDKGSMIAKPRTDSCGSGIGRHDRSDSAGSGGLHKHPCDTQRSCSTFTHIGRRIGIPPAGAHAYGRCEEPSGLKGSPFATAPSTELWLPTCDDKRQYQLPLACAAAPGSLTSRLHRALLRSDQCATFGEGSHIAWGNQPAGNAIFLEGLATVCYWPYDLIKELLQLNLSRLDCSALICAHANTRGHTKTHIFRFARTALRERAQFPMLALKHTDMRVCLRRRARTGIEAHRYACLLA